MSRRSRIFAFLLILGVVTALSGCIFPEESVTVDIYGRDQINPNVTAPNGLRIRINSEVDTDLNNMSVTITVPERIHFKGTVGGKPLKLEKKGLTWVYSFTTDLPAGETKEFSFQYMPEIYEGDFKGGNEYSFTIRVAVFDSSGKSIGNQTATWRVTRTV